MTATRAALVRTPGGPEAIELTEIEIGDPGPTEVLIDVEYAGVGYVDVLFRSGEVSLPTPFVPGIEVTGTVAAVGDRVEGLAPGRPVAALLNDFGRADRAGGYARCCLADQTMATALPDGIDPATAAGALSNGVTAWIALRELARVGSDETVLVLGAGGGLGSITTRLAAALGVGRVVGVVSTDTSRVPDVCTDALLVDELAGWLDDPDHGVDVVIDPTGGPARQALLARLSPFRRHIVLGDASGADTPVGPDGLWHASATVTGLSVGGIAHLRPGWIRTGLTTVLDLLASGVLAEPAPVVRPLSGVVAVHQAIADRTASAKTVLDVRV